MNITERNETIFELAMLGYQTLDSVQRKKVHKALIKFGTDVRYRRAKLDSDRSKRFAKFKEEESLQHMRAEIRRILPCSVCNIVGGNPLFKCTGDFGCSLERLRYRSSEWHPTK